MIQVPDLKNIAAEVSSTSRKQRLLIVTHSYHPMLNPRSFRWTAIAEHWAAQGHTIDVVASHVPDQPNIQQVNGVNVYRTGSGLIETIRNRIRPASRNTSITTKSDQFNAPTGSGSTIYGRFKIVLRAIHDLTWKNLYWPDYAFLWIHPATRLANSLIIQNGYDRIITVSDPFSVHLVGRRLKKEFSGLPWLVDIGDPFCFRDDTPTNNYRLYRSLNYRCEREIFEMADRITVTVESTRVKYAELFPESAGKMEVIGPLCKTIEGSTGSQPILKPSHRKKLLFVGTLYRRIRNPRFLLELFSQLNARSKDWVELHFVGGYDECRDICESFQEKLDGRLFFHGLLPRETVLQAVQEADMLINIGNSNPYQLPSKIVEYASTGKPILNISSIENDSSKIFLSGYAPFVDVIDRHDGPDEETTEAVARFIDEGSVDSNNERVMQIRQKFCIETIAGEYMRAIVPRHTEELSV